MDIQRMCLASAWTYKAVYSTSSKHNASRAPITYTLVALEKAMDGMRAASNAAELTRCTDDLMTTINKMHSFDVVLTFMVDHT